MKERVYVTSHKFLTTMPSFFDAENMRKNASSVHKKNLGLDPWQDELIEYEYFDKVWQEFTHYGPKVGSQG